MTQLQVQDHRNAPTAPADDQAVASWRYPVISPGDRAGNNAIEAHFKSVTIAFAVMNEIPQNINDAARFATLEDGTLARVTPTVRVTFKEIAWDSLEQLNFGGAKAHIDACELPARTRRVLVPGASVPVLCIEDDGTGLTGDIEPTLLPVSNAQKYMFETNSGGGSRAKRGSQGGRHGVGAEVVTIGSTQRTAYVHTTREDGTSFATGRSSLKTHVLGDESFQSLGSYCTPRDRGVGPCLGGPADLVHEVLGFRRGRDEPGMSVAIIDPVDELTFESVFAACVASQFFQIASGDIRFEIVDERDGRTVTLDAASIRGAVARPDLKPVLERYGKLKGRREYRVLAAIVPMLDMIEADGTAAVAATAQLSEGSGLLFDDADAAALRDTLASGGIAKFDLPVTLLRDAPTEADPRATETVGGVAVVSMREAPELEVGLDVRVRDSIVVVAERPGQKRLSITRVAKDALAACIGDCEDPAHREVKASYGSDRGWVDANAAIIPFLNAPAWAARALAAAEEQTDTVGLAQYFPMPAGQGRRKSAVAPVEVLGVTGATLVPGEQEVPGTTARPVLQDPEDTDEGDGPGDVAEEPGEPELVTVTRDGSRTGFFVEMGQNIGAFLPEGTKLVVDLAYLTRSGAVSNRKVTAGTRIAIAGREGQGEISVASDGTRIEVSDVGFDFKMHVVVNDRNRDLRVSTSLEEAA